MFLYHVQDLVVVVVVKGDTTGILLLKVSCPADMNVLAKEDN